MASLVNDPNGQKRIQFVGADGDRKAIRLGKASQRDAESIQRHIEALASADLKAALKARKETGAVPLEDIKSELAKRSK